jgi:hypothetical protein
MKKIKVNIRNSAYDSWEYTQDEIKIDIPNLIPSKHKLLHDDIILVNCYENPVVVIVDSPFRDALLAGVLVLNKTFGRINRRLLYKCIPDNRALPAFLVPYDVAASFSKSVKNKYIVFRFQNWVDEHPHGEIKETLGDVDSVEVFNEYQLWRKNLNVSLSHFSNASRSLIKRTGNDEAIYIKNIMEISKYNIEDYRRFGNVFTIDPISCTDFDDAFSVTLEDNYAIVNVYIANVYVWLETYELWNHMTNRVSTIYLPDKKRPMLPPLLSDTLCSLKQGCDRFAFMMSIKYDMSTNQQVGETVYKNVLIRVAKNYDYEDPSLVNNPAYKVLRTLASTSDSHDVVAYWMIKMNTECAEYLKKRKQGVFRCAQELLSTPESSLKPCGLTIKNWLGNNGSSASYSLVSRPHTQLAVESYVHITSPIRRLVDILNQIQFMKLMGTEISDSCDTFLKTWLNKLDFVNRTTKDIRKTQMDCELLALSGQLINKELTGVLFDRNEKDDGRYEYTVYIEKLKLMSRVKLPIYIDNFVEGKFRIFVFNDENRLCKKIRLQMIE